MKFICWVCEVIIKQRVMILIEEFDMTIVKSNVDVIINVIVDVIVECLMKLNIASNWCYYREQIECSKRVEYCKQLNVTL